MSILTLMNLILYDFCEQNLKNYCLKYRRKEMNDFDLAKGGEEAINKISEIELKEFLGVVSTYPELDGINEDRKISLAINANPSGESNGTTSIGAEPIFAIELNRINEILKEMGYSQIPNDFIEGHAFHKITVNGKEYYQFNFVGDQTFGNTCINILSISYSGGIYKVVFTYTDSISEENEFNIK